MGRANRYTPSVPLKSAERRRMTPAYHALFQLGADATPYRKLSAEGVRVERALGRDILVVEREALRSLARAGADRHQPSAAPRPSRPARQDSRRSRSHRQRQVRRLRSSQERQYRRRRRAADVPGHRHRDRHRQERPPGVDRGRRRSGDRAKASATPTPRRTCATARSRRFRCSRRRTPATTCPRRSRSPPRARTPTSSCSWPRAAARPTRPSSIRRRRRS